MLAAKPADVDAYLAAQPPQIRTPLIQVRAAMRGALPGAVEAIKYGMPAYLVDGRAVASFAGWKDHYAVYIVDTALFAAIAAELPGREASKGIIRFALDESVPASLTARLAGWVAERSGARPAAAKKSNKNAAAAKTRAAPARRAD